MGDGAPTTPPYRLWDIATQTVVFQKVESKKAVARGTGAR